MSFFWRFALLIFWGITSLAICAEEKDDVFSLSLRELLELKVASASRFTESLNQTPVPVSVITQSMIEASGKSTLRDLLTLYVPSFTQVQDQNEYNVAFRGIYTSSQQKILILLDGQRINSYAYSSSNPDHAISLDKLKQIEIIRGPGSSVYGNVALTAVINLVLKSGADDPGLYSKVKAGSHGARSIYSEWSQQSDNIDYFAWAYYYESQGEDYLVTPENDYSPNPSDENIVTRLDAFDDRPAVDLGLAIKASDWASRINYRRAHYAEPFSGAGISGEAYRYDDYPKFNSVGPGAESSWLHINGEKKFKLSDSDDIYLMAHFDRNRIGGPLVINPSAGLMGDVSWNEESHGVSLEWARNLESGKLILGLQHEDMEVINSAFSTYINGSIASGPIEVLALGQESVSSIYSQYKQSIGENWLLNLGGRFDIKDRFTGSTIEEFSPRLAFIYNQPDYNLKLSYARSFVDPPFWNRYSVLPSFRGSRDLQPEILESYQISPEWLFLNNSLSVKLNFFYNQHSDFVFRNNAAPADQPIYTNSGKMDTYGLEHEWHYQFDKNSIRLVASHYRVESVEFYEAQDDEIFNIPQTQVSVIWDTQLSAEMSAQLSARYLSDRHSPINIAASGVPVADPFPAQGVDFQVPDNRLPGVNLLAANIKWRAQTLPLELNLQIENLLDKKWQQGGSTVHPYPQTGRWTQLSVAYRW